MFSPRFLQISALHVLVLLLIFSYAQHEQLPLVPSGRRPNILFVLTDDQDLHMDSLSYMPLVKENLADKGLTYQRHYCTVALCCPSRVSMWTGKAAHNTNVTDINPPYGGYPKFASQGFNDRYLPIWMQDAGYGTYYVGKLFNAQTVDNYASPHAAGWTGNEFLLDPYTYRYWNATLQRNHDEPVSYEGQYVTDVLLDKAQGFLDDGLAALRGRDEPFFLTVAPTAPHTDVTIKQKVIHGNFSEGSNKQNPPIPADRHKHLFNDVVVPRTQNFNPDMPGGASWISRLPKQNETNVEFNDDFYRNRLRALQSVDEMVESLVKKLEDEGVMDNTYIFYSTDNGYSIGQHRRQPGKQCAFEEDINVPFIVRGPNVPINAQTNAVTSHTDLASTFLSLAHAQPPSDITLDGHAIPLTARELEDAGPDTGDPAQDASRVRQEHVNVEMWGIIMSEGEHGSVLYLNHTYKALRVAGQEWNLLYTVWCSGDHELYEMNSDPGQLHNLYNTIQPLPLPLHSPSTPFPNSSIPLLVPYLTYLSTLLTPTTTTTKTLTPSKLVSRLDTLLLLLKTCTGRACTHPWESIFPNGEVRTLTQALDARWDGFFEEGVTRVAFERCEKGFIAESEGVTWEGLMGYGVGVMGDEVAGVEGA